MDQIFSTNLNRKGQGLVEYALLSALMGLVVVGALMAFGPEIKVVAVNLMSSVSNGYTVVNGNLVAPDEDEPLDPGGTHTPTPTWAPAATFTRTASPTPTASPTQTYSPTPTASLYPTDPSTPTPTWTPIVIVTPTLDTLACVPGSATNITSSSVCTTLRDINNCEYSSYSSRRRTCSWY